jgi:DNA-binding GntR family transcriptional regulator
MLELFEVRAALEEFATRMATPVLKEDTSALQAEVDAMADAARRDDVPGIVAHSERFHQLVIDASGNDLLRNVWSSLGITDHTALTMVTLSLDLHGVAQAHQPIVDAIASGDIEVACRVSREHQAHFEHLLASQTQTV